jgi:uncharacterized protein DUF87
MGGRTFDFESGVTSSAPLGRPVLLVTPDGRRFLGQVIEKRLQSHDDPHSGSMPHTVVGRGPLTARLDEDGVVDVDAADSFDRATMVLAPADVTDAWSRHALAGATTLAVGDPDQGLADSGRLIASGFNRHTFLCGQSGSGKTYTLGVILEQLLLKTELPMVILDPNSDYVRLDELDVASDDKAAARAAELRRRTCVFRGQGAGSRQLKVRFGRLPLRQQAMVLALDPLQDAEQYDVLRRLTEQMGSTEYSLLEVRRRLDPAVDRVQRDPALRIDNLGVANWEIWAGAGEAPMLDQLPPDWRAAVLDLGGLARPEERSVMAASALAALWEQRHARNPLLIVIDEAHNVCPQLPTDHHQALAIEHTVRIAAEGPEVRALPAARDAEPAEAACQRVVAVREPGADEDELDGGRRSSRRRVLPRPPRSRLRSHRFPTRRGPGRRPHHRSADVLPERSPAVAGGWRRRPHVVGDGGRKLANKATGESRLHPCCCGPVSGALDGGDGGERWVG